MNRLRIIREEHEEKVSDLADLLGSPPGTIRNWERGEREMDCDTMIRIADHYDISVDYLIGRDYDLKSLSKDEYYLLNTFRSFADADKEFAINFFQLLMKYK